MTTESEELAAEIERIHEALLAIEKRQLACERETLKRLERRLLESDIAYGKRVEQENTRQRSFTEAAMLEKAPAESRLLELEARLSVGSKNLERNPDQ